ncbi:T9SS type A sorting domain-containing protein [Flavobacterium wongokense]|uniref:T9SS type A sorting domain-containing protein n=1 Tax=Flavobacterium wongokense TaxID=2910674 RepID=UPI001F1F0DFB|nr:T9SS type A sorting domain-containing protein [Flavobacterium sp. WG47]MCF6130749.1 T9SS type A sorting domain-containing protein [Flavobacterium sp. WG47]
MKNSTLFSVETRFKDRFYCCIESWKGNFKFLLVLMLFMGSFIQGVSAQGTLVPSCNLIGPLEACAVADANDTSGDILINIEVARSGVPVIGVNPLTGLTDGTFNTNFAYSFPSNSSGAFIRSYGPVTYNAFTNRTTQSLMVFPGSGTPEFNLQLNATNTTSSPSTVCECSKSVSISKVAVTSSYSPILCFGQTSTLTAVGQFSDIGQYTYTLLPSGPTNTTGVFPGLAGSEAGITYTIVCESAEGCIATTSQTITQPAYNPVVLTCPQPFTTAPCLTQDAVNTAFNAWLATFSFTGGTSPVITRTPSAPNAPNACGGTITVTWSATERCAVEPVTCSSTFTVPTPPAVIVNGPENSTTNACIYANQDAAIAAFNAWLAQFTATGGCAPVGNYGQPVAPPFCGGTTTVVYNVTDRCYPGSTITRTFTITPAPAVVVNGPANSTTNACTYADQAAATAAFNAWLAQFTATGGCAPVGNYGQPVAPPFCGGTTTVVYNVTDRCYQGSTITRTFTITPAPAVNVITSPDSTTNACIYANQDAATAAFNAWLAGFSVSGGCAPVGSFGEGTPQAPAYCGGATTVIYTVTDKCYQTTTYTRVFTITPAPAVVVNGPENSTTNACIYADQAAATAAFNAWLAQFTVSGGCAPSGSYGEPQAPAYCGGTVTVTYNVSDKCYDGSSITRTFTITPAPAVIVNGPVDSTTNACIYADQAAATAAFNAWLAQFTVSGGCAPSGSYGEPQAPAYCGGTVSVTYRVSDRCYEGSSITRTFTITPAPAVIVNGPSDVTTNACIYADQAAATAAFNAWLASFTVSGGCAPVGSYGQPQAPAYCGGTISVTYNVTDKCYEGSSITRTFTITPAPAVVINAPQSNTTNACTYANQDEATAAFNAWLAGFTVSGGCAPSGSYGEPVAPPYCGGTTSVTYRVTDKCYEGASITRVFIITPAPAVIVNGPENSTTNACIYADQAAATAAFNAWLAQFTVSGGCAPSGSYGEPQAPAYCGGTVTVTYNVSDKCYQGSTITRTFTITPAPAVVVLQAQNNTTSACIYANQDAANAAFTAWLAGFSVSGGCAPVGSFGEGTPSAPAYCGGATTVTYTVTDKCYQTTTYTATFTITPAPAVIVNGPENSTTNACIYADQAAATAAFNAWLAQFTVSGGCAPSASYGQPQAPAFCGGTVEVTYRVSDKCYDGTSITRTFTITAAPAVVVTSAQDSTSPACSYANQAAADAAFAAWLTGFSVSGGCAPVGSYGQPTPPPYCGGTRTVTYTVTDKCYETTTHTATFTITAPPAVIVTGPADSTTSASAYADQAAADAAFAAWLAQFSVSGGCAPSGSYGQPSAPYYCGGTVSVTYTVTDKCYETTSITRTFTITPVNPPVINAPESTSSNACIYADQAAADAAFAAWLAQFSVSGGINPVGSFGEGTPSAPQYCGGTTTVTYTVTDRCYEPIVITRTFTITPAPAVVVNGPENSTSNACTYANQDAANAAFTAWLAQFSVSGGCAPVGVLSILGGSPTAPINAPAYCGGTVSVSYSVIDKCYQGSFIVRTFTITPAPAVNVTTSQDSTSNACTYANQDAANAAFTAWLAGFSVSGGCAPVGSFGEGTPQAPAYCGGTVSVTYTVTDKCYETTTYTRTFTITPAPAVLVNGPENSTSAACTYADQAAATAAFNAWLAQFSVSGGCAPSGSYGQPQAPAYCGGTVEVTYRVSDKCYDGSSITRTFTITPAPAVVVNGPENSTASACSYADQAAATAAFNAWLAQFSVSGGCAPVGSFGEGTPQAPAYCGGTVSVTYRVTDKCYEGSSITRTFTITPAPAVVVNVPENSTTTACSYATQDDAVAAFNTWLQGFTVSGGCAPIGSFGEIAPAPAHCGGSVTVTYTVTDKCYQTTTYTRTFTITPAAPVVINANGLTTSACAYANQEALNTAFAAWLAGFTVSGGCSPVGTVQGQPVPPALCGGSVCVTYNVTDNCYTGTVTAIFTITPAPAVVVNGPENSTSNACTYANQDAANAAFTAWLAGFTVSGGCAPVGSFGEGTPQAPAYCGGTVTVTYRVTDRCYEGGTITRTFTITPAPAVVVNGPENSTSAACTYADQAAATAAFNAWLAQFSVSGGCAPSGSYGQPQAPAYCGGTVSVTYNVTDKCYQGSSITRTFTITPAPAVVVNGSANFTSNACAYANQAAATAAFNAWLAGFSVSGGCAPVGSFGEGTPQAPAYCGGTVTVTYRVTDKCYEGSTITRTFTIGAAPAVVFNCGTDVTVPSCSTQAQVNAAWTAFLASTTASGGCNGVLTRTPAQAPSICGGSASVTWTYTVGSCGQTQSCTRTFTVAAPAPVVITCGENVTLPACSTQAQLNAAWTAFLNSTTATGGCGGVLTRTSCSAPSLCGGYVDVTWTYTVASCGPQSGCGSTNSVHCTRRFTVAAPAQVAFHCGTNVTVPACSTQAQVDAAWATFLASTTASGGCGGVLTNNATTAPSICGGYKDVTWTYTVASCGQQSGCGSTNTVTCTKRFTVAAPSQVVFNCGTNVTVAACSTQAQINTAWNAFLNSTTASGGCGGVLTRSNATVPPACGGYVDVTWTYTVASCGTQSGCGANNQLTCTKRFTVAASTPVVFNCGTDVTIPACSSQTQVNNAWYAFLASTTASGGCNGVFSRTSASTPSSCGGSVNVTWTYTSTACGGQTSTQSCTRTFTVTPPAPVVLTANNFTLPACSTQAQLNAAWTAFLNSPTATGGCGGVLTRSSCSAPSLCGGYVDVTWTYTVGSCGQQSGCGTSNSQSITRRFTVAAPAPITFSAGSNVTVPACSTQAELTAAWNAFLASTTVTGGCGTTLTRTQCSAPALCGGYVDVTWTATTASCGQQSGCGSTNSQSITRRFRVEAPSQVVFNCGSNVTVAANSTQAQITAAWNAFLNSTTADGGCNGTLTRTSPAMPTTCGQYADVTWTYTVGSCGQQSGCGSSNNMTCTKRFTIGGGSTSVTINVNNVTLPSCKTQAQVNAAWASFLTSATVSGGNGTLTNNGASRTIPSACGGYADVTWTYTGGGCGQTVVTCGGQTTTVSGTYTVTRRFTVTAGGGVDVAGPSNVTYANTHFNSQYALNVAFNAWLCQFTTVSSGCSSTAVFSGDNRVAPSWTYGGTVRVTYSITGNCNSDSVCATFTVTRGADCKIEAPVTEVKNPMIVKAYPNPFSENFNLDMTTSSESKVAVAIYDMTGKLIEQREVNADEVSGLQVGDRYPSGVYNVIVTQGSEVKTLRVIKR